MLRSCRHSYRRWRAWALPTKIGVLGTIASVLSLALYLWNPKSGPPLSGEVVPLGGTNHERVATRPYPRDIIAELGRLPPFQRSGVAKHYEGLKVSWDVTLSSVQSAGSDHVSVMFLDRGGYPWVTCDIVPLVDNPELKIAKDGKSAALRVEPLTDASCQKIVVHLSGWASADQAATLALDPHQRNRQDINLEPATASP